MSESLQVALIVAAGPILVGIAQLLTALRHKRKDTAEHGTVLKEVQHIRGMLNGRTNNHE